jgi:hypothetical protein
MPNHVSALELDERLTPEELRAFMLEEHDGAMHEQLEPDCPRCVAEHAARNAELEERYTEDERARERYARMFPEDPTWKPYVRADDDPFLLRRARGIPHGEVRIFEGWHDCYGRKIYAKDEASARRAGAVWPMYSRIVPEMLRAALERRERAELHAFKPARGGAPVEEEPAPPTEPAPAYRFRLFTVEDLGELPPVEWHPGLEGFVPRRELIVLYGPGDSYKSFCALDWACHLAAEGQNVVYIAAEGGSGIQNRIHAWKLKHKAALSTLRVLPLPLKLHEPSDVDAFVADVLAQVGEADLVVVDTLARNFVGGNENSAQALGLFVDGCEEIRRRLGCTVAVVHHSTKDGDSERGGESVRNASFAVYRFEKQKRARSVRVVCERMKEAEPPQPVELHPEVVLLDKVKEDGTPETSLVAGWPYGLEPIAEEEKSDNARDAERRVQMAKEIARVLEQKAPERLSQTQVCKQVRGRDAVIVELLKELSLDPFSPVHVEPDVKKDGELACSVSYAST